MEGLTTQWREGACTLPLPTPIQHDLRSLGEVLTAQTDAVHQRLPNLPDDGGVKPWNYRKNDYIKRAMSPLTAQTKSKPVDLWSSSYPATSGVSVGDASQFISGLISLTQSRLEDTALHPSVSAVLDADLSELRKSMFASETRPYAQWDREIPWISYGTGVGIRPDVTLQIVRYLSALMDSLGIGKQLSSTTAPSQWGAKGVGFNVVYGSYTGLEPYIPTTNFTGNALACALNVQIAMHASLLCNDDSKRTIASAIRETMAGTQASVFKWLPDDEYIVSFKRIRRTRVRDSAAEKTLKASYPIYSQINPGELVASSVNNGLQLDMRQVMAANSITNVLRTPMVQLMNDVLKKSSIFNLSPKAGGVFGVLKVAQGMWGGDNVIAQSADQSKYDQHCGVALLEYWYSVVQSVFGYDTRDVDWLLESASHMPLYTSGYLDAPGRSVEKFRTDGTIKSGFKDTSVMGKLIMFGALLQGMVDVGWFPSPAAAMRSCLNLAIDQLGIALPAYECKWAFVNSSDDSFIVINKKTGWNLSHLWRAIDEKLGFETKPEDGIVMLKQYAIDTGDGIMTSRLMGSQAVSLVNPEHKTLDPMLTGTAVYGRLMTLGTAHPLFHEYCDMMSQMFQSSRPDVVRIIQMMSAGKYDQAMRLADVQAKPVLDALVASLDAGSGNAAMALRFVKELLRAGSAGDTLDPLSDGAGDASGDSQGDGISMETMRPIIAAMTQGLAGYDGSQRRSYFKEAGVSSEKSTGIVLSALSVSVAGGDTVGGGRPTLSRQRASVNGVKSAITSISNVLINHVL